MPWVATRGPRPAGGDHGVQVPKDRGGDHGLGLGRLELVLLAGRCRMLVGLPAGNHKADAVADALAAARHSLAPKV